MAPGSDDAPLVAFIAQREIFAENSEWSSSTHAYTVTHSKTSAAATTINAWMV